MNKNSNEINQTSENPETESSEQIILELTNLATNELLPPADLQSIIPSVVEETTKNLIKIERK